jgi:hypothetical protein
LVARWSKEAAMTSVFCFTSRLVDDRPLPPSLGGSLWRVAVLPSGMTISDYVGAYGFEALGRLVLAADSDARLCERLMDGWQAADGVGEAA